MHENHKQRQFCSLCTVGVLLAVSAIVLCTLAGCERKLKEYKSKSSTQPASTAQSTVYIPELTPEMQALAAQPAGVPTGLFIDRPEATQLRFVNYNVNWDRIFPDVDQDGAEKFQRLVKALDPDVLTIQEIGDRDAERKKNAKGVAALMDAINPLPAGGTWHTYKGQDNVIVSKYPLSMTSDLLYPSSYRDPAMALVDLPDDRFKMDLYVLNNHFKCCDPQRFDSVRQKQADAIVSWLRDARTEGGKIDLPQKTAIIITGDLNLVGSLQPLTTLLSGDIINTDPYGEDFVPDWDNSELADAHPLHNVVGPDDYTWRNDPSGYEAKRMDFVIYSDSVFEALHKFVLNTTTMSDEDLAKARLEKFDVTMDKAGHNFDHLPLVVDFRVVAQ